MRQFTIQYKGHKFLEKLDMSTIGQRTLCTKRLHTRNQVKLHPSQYAFTEVKHHNAESIRAKLWGKMGLPQPIWVSIGCVLTLHLALTGGNGPLYPHLLLNLLPLLETLTQ